MGITIKDVAAVAGVSPATVSRVLTGNAKVAAETELHIRSVINDLGYQPDRVARALRQRRSNLIGFVAPNLHSTNTLRLLAAIEQEASANGFILAIVSSSDTHKEELHQIDRLMAQGIDGLFILPIDHKVSDKALKSISEEDVPVILIGQKPVDTKVDFISTDYAAGIEAGIRHCIRSDFHKLAFIGEGAASLIGEEQLKAYVHTVSQLEEVINCGIKVGSHTSEFGRQSALSLLEQENRPDAIICGSDLIAQGCYRALAYKNIPTHEIAVLGYGGYEPLDYLNSLSTTISLPIEEIAQEAMRLMLQRLSGLADDVIEIRISPQLIINQSK